MRVKVGYMSKKNRPKEEAEEIVKALENGTDPREIRDRYGISLSAIYRLLRDSRGLEPNPSAKKQTIKIKKLEKTLQEKDKEIALLRQALKKS